MSQNDPEANMGLELIEFSKFSSFENFQVFRQMPKTLLEPQWILGSKKVFRNVQFWIFVKIPRLRALEADFENKIIKTKWILAPRLGLGEVASGILRKMD